MSVQLALYRPHRWQDVGGYVIARDVAGGAGGICFNPKRRTEMSKRYYLAEIIGDGTETNPYRPAVADHGVAWVGVIDSDPETGAPLHPNTLVAVETENHAKLRADPRIDPMPDFALDGKLTAINTAARNGMLTALTKRGFATAAINNADGYRDALQQIGRQRGVAFDINNFDVS